MVLVNGTKGIGTGFSTDIMCYNPAEIIEYLKCKLAKVEYAKEFVPYYEGFKGSIVKLSNGKFLLKGVYEKLGADKIRVTELPVGFWTEDFKELLEELIEPPAGKDGKKVVAVVKDYDDMSKDTNVDFIITFAKGALDTLEAEQLENGCNGVTKLLKLSTTNTTTNMHLFNAEDKLKKYETVEEIMDDYFETRLKGYQIRKEYLIDAIQKELVLLSNKAKYIGENLEGTIDLRKKKREHIIALLKEKGYDQLEDDEEYKYLTKMPMDSVTEENVERLFKEKGHKEEHLQKIQSTSAQEMWLQELDNLNAIYMEYKEERERLLQGDDKPCQKKKVVKSSQTKVVVGKAKKTPLLVEA